MDTFLMSLVIFGLFPSFGALVMPRYGQSALFLICAVLLACVPWYEAWLCIPLLLLPTAAAFGADKFCEKHGAWKPVGRNAFMGGAIGFCAVLPLVFFIPPLLALACFIGALAAELRAARKQNAIKPAVRYYLAGVFVRVVLGLLMAGVALGICICYSLLNGSPL